jgi:MFS family permease
MAYPGTPLGQAPAPRVRPTTVTVAVYSLYALAALQVIGIITALAVIGPTTQAIKDYVPEGTDRDSFLTVANISVYVGIGFAVLFAIAWAVLAVFDAKGNQPARIVTWVLGGIFLCCVSFTLIGAAAGNLLGGSAETTGGIDPDELNRRVEAATPGWASIVSTGSSVIQLLLVLAVVILLALPASHDFFRKPQEQWQPPVDGGYYPPSA